MNARTLEELGWPEVLAGLAGRCRTPAGRKGALALPFLASAREAREALLAVGEARALSEQRIALPLGEVGEVDGHVERAAKGGVLAPLALRECAALARAAARTRAALAGRAAEAPRLWALAEPLSADASLADRIDSAVEPSGAVSDRASPSLGALRDRVRGLHHALKERVESLLGDEEMGRSLRDRYYTIRNERYVLPVLASARSAVPGIVHNASQSGQTLFVEPEQMVGLGNELAIASAMAAEEEERVLRELSEAVSARAEGLGRDLAVLGELDLLEAKARLASDLDAHAPEVGAPAAGFEILSLRHPILVLQGKKVVASHVRLEPPGRALVVSGPNGGGKTVAITAVGLSALMLRAGLPAAAAAGSRLPFYAEVRAAVDERGDLARDLSTFTAHLTAVREMAAGAGPGSLVLVDEIAADTDPREGAALAAAILEDLLERGATVLVTTHLDELKALALTDGRFANARVGFDSERLLPTYQLLLGSPGSSSALDVARRVGIPEGVVERARASLSGRGGALGQALRALEEERARLEAERRALGARARGGAPARGRGPVARGGGATRREGGLGARRRGSRRRGRGRAAGGRGPARRAAGHADRAQGHRGGGEARRLGRHRRPGGEGGRGAGPVRRGGHAGRGRGAGGAGAGGVARPGRRGARGLGRGCARPRRRAQGSPPARRHPPAPGEGPARPLARQGAGGAARGGRGRPGRAHPVAGAAARRPRAAGRGAAARRGALPRPALRRGRGGRASSCTGTEPGR